MIRSMTGYGRAEYLFADHKTIVEIRAVNSKQLDLSMRVSSLYHDFEPELRSLLLKPLERGKVDASIIYQSLSPAAERKFTPINWEAVDYYVRDVREHAPELGLQGDALPPELLNRILSMPDVLKDTSVEPKLTPEEQTLLVAACEEALGAFNAFREQEGAALQAMFEEKLCGIEALLTEIEPYEKGRVEHIRQHLLDNLNLLAEKTQQAVDRNRLEQEMIYYLEKLDITEEKVRLTNHIRYFRECMNSSPKVGEVPAGGRSMSPAPSKGVGKTLGFVAQEMGREINTLGSKSNQSEMQILVVKMKDILEQIKEQVLNVL